MASVLALLLVTVATDTRVREGLTTEPPTVTTPPVPPQPQPQPSVMAITPDDVRKRTFQTMVATLEVTPRPWHFLLRPEMGLAVFACLGAWGLWLALRRRRLLPEPEPLAPADSPARAFPLPAVPAGTVLLAPREQEGLAWGIGRFVSEEPTRRLDLAATVRATALAGGLPSIQFHRARFYREVWLWVDETADDPALPRLAGEIEAVLAAHGLPVERASFRGIPDRLVTNAGQVFAPNEIDERRDVALVAILTDGRLLVRRWAVDDQRGHIDALLRSLSHWPRLAFVDASRDRDGLAPILGRHGLTVIVPEATAAFLGGSALPKETQAVRGAEQDSEIAWAAACALCPAPVDEMTALELRRQLALPASPYALQALRAEAPGPPGRLAWRTPDRIRRVSWLRDAEAHPNGAVAPKSLLDRALAFWEDVYARSLGMRVRAGGGDRAEAPAGRFLHMERALLGLWRGPHPYAAELYQLFQGPLREVIRQHCGILAPAGWGGPGLIQLPWSWSEPTPVEREMLREMGLGGGMPRAGLRRPGRAWLGIGLLAGLGLAAVGMAAFRGRASTEPEIVHAGVSPTRAITEAVPTPAGSWWVTVSTRQRDVAQGAESGSRVLVRWQRQERPCVETGSGGEETWLCGRLAAPASRLSGVSRSMVFLDRDLSKDRGVLERLALDLLDSGSADAVTIGRDPGLEIPAPIKGQQTFLLTSFELQPGYVPDRATWLRVKRLIGEDILRFEGLRPLSEVFPDSTIAEGDPSNVFLRGLGSGCRNTQMEENGFTFVRICPGTFTMGSQAGEPMAYDEERPAHQVTLDEFWMSKFETTNEHYRKLHSGPSGAPDQPVTEVTWAEARDFCEKLGYRLPTEAEWEYAARAGTETSWSFGNGEKDLGRFAWLDENSGGEPHPVGRKEPNPWGLHDMHGNVWEWVNDWFGDYPAKPQVSPTGPLAGSQRVLRGGSFGLPALVLRSAFRGRGWPEDRVRDFGFRCVRGPRRQS